MAARVVNLAGEILFREGERMSELGSSRVPVRDSAMEIAIEQALAMTAYMLPPGVDGEGDSVVGAEEQAEGVVVDFGRPIQCRKIDTWAAR